MTQREHIEAEVEKWRESRLTKKEFCQQQGIKESTFGYWITRSNQQRKKGFIPIGLGQSLSSSQMELTYPNGVRIKLAASDLKTLSQLIHLY